jgi:UPF0716 protein FxsA
MIRWLGLFVGIPLIELVLLIEVGQRIGTIYTIGIIVVPGALGATLARQEGDRLDRGRNANAAAG